MEATQPLEAINKTRVNYLNTGTPHKQIYKFQFVSMASSLLVSHIGWLVSRNGAHRGKYLAHAQETHTAASGDSVACDLV